MITDEQAAYIAGLIDGEGCIKITKERRKKAHWSDTYTYAVTVCNSNLEILQWLRQVTGFGRISPKSQKKDRNWKQTYDWELLHGEIPIFLNRISKYLRVKLTQAELVLEYIRDCEFGAGSGIVSDSISIRREVIYGEMRLLNARGPIIYEKETIENSNVLTSEEQSAYIAGFVDGEGHISLGRALRNNNTHYFYPCVKITSTDKKILEWLHKVNGFGIIYTKSKERLHIWKQAYDWNVQLEYVYRFLGSLVKYLRIKQLQAELVLEYFRKCYNQISTSEIEFLSEVIYSELKELNKRGIKL